MMCSEFREIYRTTSIISVNYHENRCCFSVRRCQSHLWLLVVGKCTLSHLMNQEYVPSLQGCFIDHQWRPAVFLSVKMSHLLMSLHHPQARSQVQKQQRIDKIADVFGRSFTTKTAIFLVKTNIWQNCGCLIYGFLRTRFLSLDSHDNQRRQWHLLWQHHLLRPVDGAEFLIWLNSKKKQRDSEFTGIEQHPNIWIPDKIWYMAKGHP